MAKRVITLCKHTDVTPCESRTKIRTLIALYPLACRHGGPGKVSATPGKVSAVRMNLAMYVRRHIHI